MPDYRSDLKSSMRQAGAIAANTDEEAIEAACVLFEAQRALARMKGDRPFATAVQAALSAQQKVAAAAEKEAGGAEREDEE
jgi:hypothetical protein